MIKKTIQRDPRRIETGGVAFHPPNPELSEQLFSQVRHVEDFDEPRTKLDACFNILPLHIPVFTEQLHPTPFILRAA